MESLPKTVVDRLRGFLKTKDILLSRRVCSDWMDVDDIPKSLFLSKCKYSKYPVPPPEVHISNVTKLNIMELQDASEVLRILHMCAPTLHTLEISCIPLEPMQMPLLSKVTTLILGSKIKPALDLTTIFQKIPNVKKLTIYGDDAERLALDFGLIPDVEYISVLRSNISFRNVSQICLRQIVCIESYLDMISAVIGAHPDARVDVPSRPNDIENLNEKLQFISNHPRYHHKLVVLSTSSENEFRELRFRIEVFENKATFTGVYFCFDNWSYAAERLKAIISQLRKHGMTICARVKSGGAQTKLIALFTMTRMFSMQELGDICYQLA